MDGCKGRLGDSEVFLPMNGQSDFMCGSQEEDISAVR